MNKSGGILLESGTNEVEILEFQLDGQGFGVNVLKVQAIEQFDRSKVTEIQLAHPAVIGTYQYRDGVVTLVNLGQELEVHAGDVDVLSRPDSEAVDTVLAAMPEPEPDAATDETNVVADPTETRIVLVLEFNEVTTGFLVDGVNRIHRVSWNAISPLSPFLAATQSKFTGSLAIEEREVLVMDMERILADILPSASGAYHVDEHHDTADDERRAQIPVYLAEDSVTIRDLITKELQHGGYEQVHAFDNGQACHDAIQNTVNEARAADRPVAEVLGILVSDIEMPLMDGMTLCKKVKNDLGLTDTPVVLFSSLINEQIRHKCDSVGADACISKPRFNEMVEMVDKFVLDAS